MHKGPKRLLGDTQMSTAVMVPLQADSQLKQPGHPCRLRLPSCLVAWWFLAVFSHPCHVLWDLIPDHSCSLPCHQIPCPLRPYPFWISGIPLFFNGYPGFVLTGYGKTHQHRNDCHGGEILLTNLRHPYRSKMGSPMASEEPEGRGGKRLYCGFHWRQPVRPSGQA